MVKTENNKKLYILFFAVMFVFFFAIAYMIPFTGDDWAWGAEIGLERLRNHFRNYNGRYLGNLIVIALTRSRLLRAFVMSAVFSGSVYFLNRTVGNNSVTTLLAALICFFAMPSTVLRQTVAWTSGFSNYVVPTFLIILYFFIIRDIAEGSPSFKWGTAVGTFFVGICACLFMENLTIYLVAVDVLIIILTHRLFGKVYTPVLTHLVGSVIGCAVMFTNSAYIGIFKSNDSYRTIGTDSDGFFGRMRDNLFFVIRKKLVLNNVYLNIIILAVCVALAVLFFKKNKNRPPKSKAAVISSLSVIALYTAYSVFRAVYQAKRRDPLALEIITSIFLLLFLSALILLAIVCVENIGVKTRLVFYIAGIVIVTAPLFIVTPLSSRCFYCQYMFFVLYVCEALGYVIKERNVKVKPIVVRSVLGAACVACAAFYLVIYTSVYSADLKKSAYIRQQIAEKKQVVIIPDLPHKDYLCMTVPHKGTIWIDRYKVYCGIDRNAELKFISYDEWQKS